MTEIENFIRCLSYNPDTGALIWVATPSKRAKALIGKPAGTVHRGRLTIRIGGKGYRAHRVMWAMTYKKWPDGEIDHIDGNPLNNRLSNLRDVSRLVNQQNIRVASRKSQSGLLGAHKNRNKWLSRLKVNGKQMWLGVFANAKDAHQAYLNAKRLYHPGCTI